MLSNFISQEIYSPGVVLHDKIFSTDVSDAKDAESDVDQSLFSQPTDNHNLKSDQCPLSRTRKVYPGSVNLQNQSLEIQFGNVKNTNTHHNITLFLKQLMNVKANLWIGVTGKNRIQLMKLIIKIFTKSQTKIGFFTESVVNGLNLRQSPIEYLSIRFENDLNLLNINHPTDRTKYIRKKLRQVSLKSSQFYKRMKYLTQVELYRVALCVSTWNEPAFLIMNGAMNQSNLDVLNEFCGHTFLVTSPENQHLLGENIDEYWSSN